MTPRQTEARLAIARAILLAKEPRHWGYELSRQAGVGAGSMYPFLRELVDGNYLTDGWQDPAETEGRPPRRYYVLTDAGKTFLRQFVDSAPAARRARAARRAPGTSWAAGRA